MSKKVKVSKYVADRIGRTKKDFRIDTYRSQGNGGQNVNKVESGVRITDLKTGLAVACQEHRDQPKNKQAAFFRLVDKLIEHYRKEELAQIVKDNTPHRAIRTYKLTKNQVIDHRLDVEFEADRILNGRLDPLVMELIKLKGIDR